MTDYKFFNSGVVIREIPNGGRTVFLSPLYCSHQSHQSSRLRSGGWQTLFENAIRWASSKNSATPSNSNTVSPPAQKINSTLLTIQQANSNSIPPSIENRQDSLNVESNFIYRKLILEINAFSFLGSLIQNKLNEILSNLQNMKKENEKILQEVINKTEEELKKFANEAIHQLVKEIESEKTKIQEEREKLEQEKREFEELEMKTWNEIKKFDQFVKLNVGGKLFDTSICSLIADQNSMLSSMFSGRFVFENFIKIMISSLFYLDFLCQSEKADISLMLMEIYLNTFSVFFEKNQEVVPKRSSFLLYPRIKTFFEI